MLTIQYIAPPTYSWDGSAHPPQQQWAHYQQNPHEMSGEARRSELYGQTPGNGLAELHGNAVAGELESPENSPRPAQGEFTHHAREQQVQGLGVTVGERGGER